MMLRILLSLILLPVFVSAENVTLNFRETDIKEVINIISEVTQKTFIVDPRVNAKVTIISNESMDSEQVYEVFLSILSIHGFTAVPNGNVIKILPYNLAKSESSTVLLKDETLKSDILVTQIVHIKHVEAAKLIPLLRPLIRQQGHLVAYPTNNTLIISDTANNIQRLLKIIQRIDQADDQNIEIIVLEHASATEVVLILSKLEQKTTQKTKKVNIVADKRSNSILISGDSAMRLRLRTLITHLDTPIKSMSHTKVIYLRYAQAKELVNILKGISDSIWETEKAKGQTISPNMFKTDIQADETTNSLVITAPPKILQNLTEVINKLDIRRAQVLVEAVIAEVSSDTARELGMQWLVYNIEGTASPVGVSNFNNGGIGITNLAGAVQQNNISNMGAGAFMGLGKFTDGVVNFMGLLNALTIDSKTNVLSTPSLLTLDNQEAEIVVGQNVPFITGQYTSTGTTGSVTNPFQTIQREDVGIKLIVKPQINEGDTIQLEIQQEVSSINASSLNTSDIITNKRTIKTTVIVENGHVIVLGGLIDDDLQQITQKIPFLGDLPLIGGLFRSNSTKKIKRNLMIFLHPVIIRDAESEKFISTHKYNYMRSKQLEQKSQGVSLMSDNVMPILPNLDDFLTVLPGEEVLTPEEIEPELYVE